jgi:hypothetical protein
MRNGVTNMLMRFKEMYLLGVGGGGHAVAQLAEVLRYKPEGRGYDCEMSRKLGASNSWNYAYMCPVIILGLILG